MHLTLTGWPKRTYCTHRLEKQAKRNLESKRIPRQHAVQTWRSPAGRRQQGATHEICTHDHAGDERVKTRLQRSETSSCEADNSAPPNSLAIRTNRATKRQPGCFLRGRGLTFDVSGGPLAGRPLDGGVRSQATLKNLHFRARWRWSREDDG